MALIKTWSPAAALLLLPAGLAVADPGEPSYSQATGCEKSALSYYDKTERVRNTSNNELFYESYMETHYNISANKCFVLISSMSHKYKDDTASWSDTLIDVEEEHAFGSFVKVVNLRTSTVGELRCDLNGQSCASKDEFKQLAKAYMEE